MSHRHKLISVLVAPSHRVVAHQVVTKNGAFAAITILHWRSQPSMRPQIFLEAKAHVITILEFVVCVVPERVEDILYSARQRHHDLQTKILIHT